MTFSLVSLLAANIDEAASDLAAHLTSIGIDTVHEAEPHAQRLELVTTGAADIVWSCGWQALAFGSLMNLVAAPTFPHEDPSSYRSFIVSRTPVASLEELIAADPLWAMNEPASWSGNWALRAECDLRRLVAPSRIVWSGSHVESMRMVADGSADAAAIDSTVWRWAGDCGLAVVDSTRPWPAPPLLIRNRIIEDDAGRVVAGIVGATRLRGVEALDRSDWGHLDPMRRWAES